MTRGNSAYKALLCTLCVLAPIGAAASAAGAAPLDDETGGSSPTPSATPRPTTLTPRGPSNTTTSTTTKADDDDDAEDEADDEEDEAEDDEAGDDEGDDEGGASRAERRLLRAVGECVQTTIEDGQVVGYQAFFGYEHSGEAPLRINPGSSANRLLPRSLAQSQPRSFEPGGRRSVVVVPFSSGSVTWRLGESEAELGPTSSPCSPPPQVPEFPLAALAPLVAAGAGAGYVAYRRRRPLPA